MTTLAVMLGLWAIGATFWALEERAKLSDAVDELGVLREDRNYWYAMYVKATPDIRCKVASEETKE